MKFCLELLDLKCNRNLSISWFYLMVYLAYASKSIIMEISRRRKLKAASHITSQSRVENGRLMCAAGAPLTFTLLNSSVQKPFLREWCHPQSMGLFYHDKHNQECSQTYLQFNLSQDNLLLRTLFLVILDCVKLIDKITITGNQFGVGVGWGGQGYCIVQSHIYND